MSNLRNTKEFREALLAAYGVTEDKDVENKDNFKKAILDALGISYTTEDIKNFEKFRALLVSSADNLADNLIAENIKKDVEILGITGSYEGGGSSDFTTAEVTLVNSGETNIAVVLPVFYEAAPPFSPNAYVTSVVNILPNETSVLNVPLYKGHCSIPKGISGDRISGDMVATSFTVTSGSATSSIGGVDVTGNCTIAISAS